MKAKVQDLMITVSAFGLLIMLGISMITIGSKLFIAKSPSMMAGYEHRYTEVVVQPGDTLWSIARFWVPDEDPRAVVGTIRELNELSSADIYPGQVLAVYLKATIEPLQVAHGTRSAF